MDGCCSCQEVEILEEELGEEEVEARDTFTSSQLGRLLLCGSGSDF
jgi:hypothetical protein